MNEIVLPSWKNIDIGAALRERFQLSVQIDNDANLGALAERWWGVGRGISDFAYIKVGTGVGSGHIIAGRIYRGASGIAGEIGHLSLDPQGVPCVCGLRGCLYTLAGARGLVERATHLAQIENSLLTGQKLSIRAIEEAALAGDSIALKVVSEAADHLGIAVATMINLMNPAMVVIGGGLARVGDILLTPLRKAVQKRTLVTSVAASKIVASELGAQAIAVGAATLVLEWALTDLRNFPVVASGSAD